MDIDLALICLLATGSNSSFYSMCWIFFPQRPKQRQKYCDSKTLAWPAKANIQNMHYWK